jgi:hypothetical protein
MDRPLPAPPGGVVSRVASRGYGAAVGAADTESLAGSNVAGCVHKEQSGFRGRQGCRHTRVGQLLVCIPKSLAGSLSCGTLG